MLDKITKIITFYQENGSKMAPLALLETQDQLTGNLFFFSELVALAYETYEQAKLDRKMFIVTQMEKYIAEGMNRTGACTAAEKDAYKFYADENKSEVNFKRYKMVLDTAGDVLGGIKQRISTLNKERYEAPHGNIS